MNQVTGTGRTSGVSANLELVNKLCYLGDMLSVDGDADAAVEARIRTGWNKFRQFVPLLTNKSISLIMRGRLYSSCVHSSMLHGNDIISVLQQNRLHWYGHVLQKEDNDRVKKCMDYEMEGARPRGTL